MALKPEHKNFIKYYIKTGDHIASYQKIRPNADRKTAASNGKRLLKNAEIAAAIREAHAKEASFSAQTIVEDVENADLSAELTPKQRRFCEEYIVDLNATQAAIRAGFGSKAPGETGYEQLKKTEVQKYVAELMAARSARTEIKADDVLREMAVIAFARVNDFVRIVEVEKQEVGMDEDGTMVAKTVLVKEVEVVPTAQIPVEKLPALLSIKSVRGGLEIKMHDKVRALENLGRHLGMWNDKLKLDSTDELKELYKSVMGGTD